jgi:hypothetical protein
MRFVKVSLAALLIASAALGAMSCTSPAAGSTTSAVVSTKYTSMMIFDHQRSYNSTTKVYTASSLVAPYDDSSSSYRKPIAELTVGDSAYLAGAYITLSLTIGTDSDTISKAALVLKNSSGTTIRTISASGSIKYMGAKGFVYISDSRSYGYFFSKAVYAYGESVSYTVTTETVTKESELVW